jgi:hypothetical protein
MSGFLHLVVPKSRFYVQAVRAIRVLRASGSGLRGERAHVSADLANGSYSRRLVSKLPSEKAVQSGPGGGVQADRGDGRSLEER